MPGNTTVEGQIFLILDALNEPIQQTQQDILALLDWLSTFIPQMRIIITSQRTEKLVSVFQTWTTFELQAQFHDDWKVCLGIQLHIPTPGGSRVTQDPGIWQEIRETDWQLRRWFEKGGVEPLKFFSDTDGGHKGS